MKDNYVYQILKQFFINSYPPEIEEKVQRWIIKDEWVDEKTPALRVGKFNLKVRS